MTYDSVGNLATSKDPLNHVTSLTRDLAGNVTAVSNAKNQKLSNEEIKTRLKKSNWRGEQIDYAIKKFEGKRIGMWEIPIFSRREKRILKEEMMKRNPRRVVY